MIKIYNKKHLFTGLGLVFLGTFFFRSFAVNYVIESIWLNFLTGFTYIGSIFFIASSFLAPKEEIKEKDINNKVYKEEITK